MSYYDDVCSLHCAVAFCSNNEVINTINFTITYNYNTPGGTQLSFWYRRAAEGPQNGGLNNG